MTYKKWERRLKSRLHSLSRDERDRALEYYREMRDEMSFNGKSEEKIIAELGSPESCARSVLADRETQPTTRKKGGYSFAEVIGLIFFTIILVVPLSAVLISVIVAMGACSLVGVAASLGGIAFAIGYPIYIGGGTIGIAGIGLGIAASGVGLLLFVGFALVTKYAAILFGKFIRAIYKRR